MWQARTWARTLEAVGGTAYVYHFTYPNPVFRLYVPNQPELVAYPGGRRGMGAYHSGDLAYTFGTLDRVGLGWNDWDRTLSNTLMNYWINFARTGDPNGAGLPHWPAYQATEDLVLEFGEDIAAIPHPRAKLLDIFDAARPAPIEQR